MPDDTNNLLENLIESTDQNSDEVKAINEANLEQNTLNGDVLEQQLEVQDKMLDEMSKQKSVKLKIENETEQNELASAFFSMLRGPRGYKGNSIKDIYKKDNILYVVTEDHEGNEDTFDLGNVKGEQGDSLEWDDLTEAQKEQLRPKKGVDYVDGKDGEDGKDYILDEKDKKEIADMIEVPIVEKEIETIKPVVKEVAKYETGKQIKKKLLKEGIEYEEIKNAPTLEKISGIARASKTVSLTELDDVDYSGLTQDADGKYVLGSGGGGGTGDVVGPANATDNNFAAFDTTTGKLIKDSGVSSSDFATAAQGALADSALQSSDIGSSIQAWDAHLDGIAALVPGAGGRMITSDGLGGYQISTTAAVRGYLNVEDGADVTDEANVTDALDGATLTAVTVAGTDKVLIQDVSDSDNLKTVTAQSIADLASGGIAAVVDDTTPQLGGNLDTNSHDINVALGDKVAFGDGDTYIQEGSDDTLEMVRSGSEIWRWNSTGIFLAGKGGFLTAATSYTAPSVVPNIADADTGIGSGALDSISIIAGGVEGIRVTESGGSITTDINGSTNITAGDLNVQGVLYVEGTGLDVGINTTVPVSYLDINALTSDPLADLSQVNSYAERLRRNDNTLNTGVGMAFTVSTASSDQVGAAIIHERTGGNSQGELVFYTKQTSTGGADPTEVLRLNDDGTATFAGNVNGRDLSTDGTKLDGIEASADVTDETNVVAALDGATLTDLGTPAAGDLILLQDASDSNNLKVAQFSEFGGGGGGQTTFDIIVAPSGGDYTTLGAALAAASNNDRILVQNGTYTESAMTTALTGLTIIGQSKEGVDIQILANDWTFSGSGLTVKNIKITYTTGDWNIQGANSLMDNCHHYANTTSSTGYVNVTGARSYITNTYFESQSTSTASTAYLLNINGEHVGVDNCAFYTSVRSLSVIRISKPWATITNNRFQYYGTGVTTMDMVEVNSGFNTAIIANNVFDLRDATNEPCAINTGGYYSTVTGNTISGGGSKCIQVGIGCTVTGNALKYFTDTGIYVYGDGCTVTGNYVGGLSTSNTEGVLTTNAADYSIIDGNVFHTLNLGISLVSGADNIKVGSNNFNNVTTNVSDSATDTNYTEMNTKGITIESPTSSEDIGMFFTDVAITITQMNAVLRGSSTPSVTWTIRHNSDRSATGNEVVTSGTTTTSTTTGSEVTSFNDATIPAGSWVWLETTAQSGTVDELSVTIEYIRD